MADEKPKGKFDRDFSVGKATKNTFYRLFWLVVLFAAAFSLLYYFQIITISVFNSAAMVLPVLVFLHSLLSGVTKEEGFANNAFAVHASLMIFFSLSHIDRELVSSMYWYVYIYLLLGVLAIFYLPREEGKEPLKYFFEILFILVAFSFLTKWFNFWITGSLAVAIMQLSIVILFALCASLAPPPYKYLFISMLAFLIPYFTRIASIWIDENIAIPIITHIMGFFKFILIFVPIWFIYLEQGTILLSESRYAVRRYVSVFLGIGMVFLFIFSLADIGFMKIENGRILYAGTDVTASYLFNPLETLKNIGVSVWEKVLNPSWSKFKSWTGIEEEKEEDKKNATSPRTGVGFLDESIARATRPWQTAQPEEVPSGIKLGRASILGGTKYPGMPIDVKVSLEGKIIQVPVDVKIKCAMGLIEKDKKDSQSQEPVYADQILPWEQFTIEGDFQRNAHCIFSNTESLEPGKYRAEISALFNAESYSDITPSFVSQEFAESASSEGTSLFQLCPHISRTAEKTSTKGAPIELNLYFAENMPFIVPDSGQIIELGVRLTDSGQGKIRKISELIVMVPKPFTVHSITGRKMEESDCSIINKRAEFCSDDLYTVHKTSMEGGGEKREEAVFLNLDSGGRSELFKTSCPLKYFLVAARYDYEIRRSLEFTVEELPEKKQE